MTSSCSFKEDADDEENDMWVIDNDDIALDVKDNHNYNKYKWPEFQNNMILNMNSLNNTEAHKKEIGSELIRQISFEE